MRTGIAIGFGLLLAMPAIAAPFEDPLLDHMVGSWHLTGTAAGKPTTHLVTVAWVLGHQFLEIDEASVEKNGAGQPLYEAKPMIGWDARSDRYVAHWLDKFGGRFSETLGYAKREPDRLAFTFEYPDGPFHTTFQWDDAKGQWHWRMEQKTDKGVWESFADMVMTKD